MLLTIPVSLYLNAEGSWDALLLQFNDHVTPLTDKFDAYVRFLQKAPSYHWFVVIFYGALAFDALCLVARFIHWRIRSSASHQS
jgi:hypothetical protein